MRLLLTGSSGWLGRFLAPRLREEGHEVVGLDVDPGGAIQVLGPVADRALVERTFAEHGIEAVIHAGALHKRRLKTCLTENGAGAEQAVILGCTELVTLVDPGATVLSV